MGRTASLLIAVVLILLALGIVMLASTSAAAASARGGGPLLYVQRQAVWILIGAGLAGLVARMDYHWWGRPPVPVLLVGISYVLLSLVLVAGMAAKGSVRWLRLGWFGFQPSEPARFAVIVFIAWWMSRLRRRDGDLWRGLMVPAAVTGGIVLLVFVEPDFGSSMILASLVLLMLFLGGARLLYLGAGAVVGSGLFGLAILHNPERMRRILAFLNPEKYARSEAFQLVNAIYAFVIGGAMGAGLGESIQKQYYLPEAHTDFIFAIIGEELGLVGSLLVLALYAALFLLGARIASRARDRFGRLLGWGIVLSLTIQALVNIAVVTGCLPTKGLPLPFVSYGGSNMAISLLMVGVLTNIALRAGSVRGQGLLRDAMREV
ncbi:MAG TPA: putative lipid II flippase FtsW [Kiritimatiellae bacterium]|nr:putative lipid II flippase FtsW [Kiritimatiellia bacterium]